MNFLINDNFRKKHLLIIICIVEGKSRQIPEFIARSFNRNQDRKFFKLIFPTERMGKVRIKLSSTDITALNEICRMIKDIASNAGIVISGPVPLPTKRMKITTRKSPCGSGTATFDRFEMRVHKRVIDLPANDRVLHAIMRVPIPRSINIKIELKD